MMIVNQNNRISLEIGDEEMLRSGNLGETGFKQELKDNLQNLLIPDNVEFRRFKKFTETVLGQLKGQSKNLEKIV